MTDAENIIPETTEPTIPTEPVEDGEPRTFTQEEVDQIVSKRLKDEKARLTRAEAERRAKEDEEKRIASLEGEAKLKAQYEAQLKARDEALAKAQRDLATTRAEAELARADLPVELAPYVIGEDDEATAKNIAALSKAVKDRVNREVSAGLHHGTPAIGQAPAGDPLAAELDKVMKL